MSDGMEEEMSDENRLRAVTKSLASSLSFAAPELWPMHIANAIADAFDIGRRGAASVVPMGTKDEKP